jgi:hypothetical protein
MTGKWIFLKETFVSHWEAWDLHIPQASLQTMWQSDFPVTKFQKYLWPLRSYLQISWEPGDGRG